MEGNNKHYLFLGVAAIAVIFLAMRSKSGASQVSVSRSDPNASVYAQIEGDLKSRELEARTTTFSKLTDAVFGLKAQVLEDSFNRESLASNERLQIAALEVQKKSNRQARKLEEQRISAAEGVERGRQALAEQAERNRAGAEKRNDILGAIFDGLSFLGGFI
jgi:hypothetical protein